MRKLTRRLVPFLFLLYIVAYLDRINVGFAALQMQQQLGLTDAVYGAGAGVFFAGYFFFQVPSNLVLQRVGARRWIAVLMVVWGMISGSMALAQGPRSFYALRFLLGAAEAGFFPGMIFYLKSWFPANARARTVARFMTAAPLSGVVGGPISGALLGLHSSALAGWQWMFLMEAVPAVILGVVVLAYLADSPEDVTWLADGERGWLLETLRREQQENVPGPVEENPHPLAENARRVGHPTEVVSSPPPAFQSSSRRFAPEGVKQSSTFAALRMGRIWMLAGVYFGLNTVSYGVSLWLPKMIQSLAGLTKLEIGFLSAIPYIAAAVVMVLVGLHSDRTGERRWHTALPAFAGALALTGAAYSTSVAPSICLISIAVLGVFSMMGPFWAMPTGFLPATAAAAGIAFINSVGNLGGFAGPWVIGLVRTSTGQFRGGLLLVSAALGAAGMVALLIRAGKEGRELTDPA